MLKLYPIRLENWQITELERRANGNPVAPLVRGIINDWLGLDDNLQNDQIMKEIDGLTGQINLLNKQLEDIETNTQKNKIDSDVKLNRQEYLKSNMKVLDMYKNNTISPRGYTILMTHLDFSNKDEVNAWLDEQTSE